MQPVITHFEAKTVIGFRDRFISALSPDADNFKVIPALWAKFDGRIGDVQNRKDDKKLGVIFPLGAGDLKTHEMEMIYMACVEVKDSNILPKGMLPSRIPAGNYALFTHKGRLDKLAETMDYIFNEWMPKSGQKGRDAPHIEIYDRRFNPGNDASVFEIGVPVA